MVKVPKFQSAGEGGRKEGVPRPSIPSFIHPSYIALPTWFPFPSFLSISSFHSFRCRPQTFPFWSRTKNFGPGADEGADVRPTDRATERASGRWRGTEEEAADIGEVEASEVWPSHPSARRRRAQPKYVVGWSQS